MVAFTLPIATFRRSESNAVVVSKFETGNEQRRLDHPTAEVSYSIAAPNCNETDMKTYRDFYQARSGAFEAFTWTPPDESSAITVRFAGPLEINLESGYYTIAFSFIKVVA